LTADPARSSLQRALDCYRQERRFIRLFTLGRSLLAPLEQIAEGVPPRGRILDLGCGHGLFTNLLALGSAERQLLGVDPSSAKLEVARRSSRGLPNVRYQLGRIEDLAEAEFQAITILDVLYLLPDRAKLGLLRRCRALLAPDGLLLLKTNDTRPRWQYAIVRLEEEIMVRLLGFTLGGELHFRGVPAYTALLRQAGFEPRVVRLDTRLPVPHRLYVCRPVGPASGPTPGQGR
jgi:2-polyprenyl-6-hydroxyphenyl methylase/3-demethylubiquinone-9 3-methyltransferase